MWLRSDIGVTVALRRRAGLAFAWGGMTEAWRVGDGAVNKREGGVNDASLRRKYVFVGRDVFVTSASRRREADVTEACSRSNKKPTVTKSGHVFITMVWCEHGLGSTSWSPWGMTMREKFMTIQNQRKPKTSQLKKSMPKQTKAKKKKENQIKPVETKPSLTLPKVT